MSNTSETSLFRKAFLQKLRLTSGQLSETPVQEDSTVQQEGLASHQPDMNLMVEVHPDQGSEEAQQTPDGGLSETKSSEVLDIESQQSGDESIESDHQLGIQDFPNEIIEKILSNLSGTSLLRYLIMLFFFSFIFC